MSHELLPPSFTYNERVMRATEALFLGKGRDETEDGDLIAAAEWEYSGVHYRVWVPLDDTSRRQETWLLKLKADEGSLVSRLYRRINFATEARNWLQMVEKAEDCTDELSITADTVATGTWVASQAIEFEAGMFLADSPAYEAFLEDLESYKFSNDPMLA